MNIQQEAAGTKPEGSPSKSAVGWIMQAAARGVLLALLALVAGGVLMRSISGEGAMFWMIRWPLWVLGALALPLIVIRVVTWRRR